jgi:hypothetical protein
VLLEMEYTVGIKHSYRGHHYIQQNVLVLKAVHVASTMDHSTPIENIHTTIVCTGRHILRVETLSPRSLN